MTDPSGFVPASTRAAQGERHRSRWFIGAIISGTVLFLIHTLLSLSAGPDGAAPTTLVWGTGLVGVSLLIYGCSGLGRLWTASEERLRELAVTRARLQGLIDASPLAIIAGDREGRVVLWSSAATEILGWQENEVLGESYPAVPEGQGDAWREFRARVLDGETVHGVESQQVARDGRAIDVSVSAAPVRNADGEIIGTVALVDDLSQSQDAARQMEKLEIQLRQAQKLEVVGRLAAGIAHDFNNLLTAIRGNAELILASETDYPELDQDLKEIAESADRAAALTRQLLSFTHKGTVETRPVEVNRLVTGLETLMGRLLPETIELRVEPSVDAGAVLTDPTQVEQVLLNLVVNARDALPDGGRITVRTRPVEVTAEDAESLPYEVRPGPFAVISVKDNGVGMEPETVDQIFEPFFTTKPAGVGTGLGLSTVYSIVKQARGHIRVESEPGQGTRFRVFLPRHEATQPGETVKDRAAMAAGGGSETILVVEDEPAVLSMARRALERKGYEVLTALSGREALGVALKYPGEIDVLFCDMVMPDLSGREVADRVVEARPTIQVLMTSGYGERQLAGEGGLEGVEFLAKPYTPLELTTRIRQLFGEPATS